FKIVANHLLDRIVPLRDVLLLVDPFGRRSSVMSNLRAMREAIRWLKSGRLLAIFPAGEVAHFDLRTARVSDPPWTEMLARLVRAAEAPVLPMYFDGHNGPVFQLAGLVHPRLRTAMLPRELLNKRGARIEVRMGALLSHPKLATFSKDD